MALILCKVRGVYGDIEMWIDSRHVVSFGDVEGFKSTFNPEVLVYLSDGRDLTIYTTGEKFATACAAGSTIRDVRGGRYEQKIRDEAKKLEERIERDMLTARDATSWDRLADGYEKTVAAVIKASE